MLRTVSRWARTFSAASDDVSSHRAATNRTTPSPTRTRTVARRIRAQEKRREEAIGGIIVILSESTLPSGTAAPRGRVASGPTLPLSHIATTTRLLENEQQGPITTGTGLLIFSHDGAIPSL